MLDTENAPPAPENPPVMEKRDSSRQRSVELAIWIENLLALVLFTVVVGATVLILEPFFIPLLWAVVVVLTTWPVYLRFRARVRCSPYIAAAYMTAALAALLLLAVIPLSMRLTAEIGETADVLRHRLDVDRIERYLNQLPLIGAQAVEAFRSVKSDSDGLNSLILGFQPRLFAAATDVARNLLRVVFITIFTILTVYFMFVHGDRLWRQLRQAALIIGGDQALELLHTIRTTVRGAVYGTVLTALVQGILAGIGFWISGASYPVLLGFATVIFSFVPFGPPWLYLPVAATLYFSGASFYEWGFLVVWGVLVVSTADNLVRSLFISQATKLPILVVLFGALGGIVQFGLIGVLLGPVILALSLSIWFTFVGGEKRESQLHPIDTAPPPPQ